MSNTLKPLKIKTVLNKMVKNAQNCKMSGKSSSIPAALLRNTSQVLEKMRVKKLKTKSKDSRTVSKIIWDH